MPWDPVTGETRMIREVYAEHPAYVPMVRQAYRLWRRLEESSGRGAGRGCCSSRAGSPSARPDSGSILGVRRSSQEHGLPMEMLDADEIRGRWPQFEPQEEMVGAYDPNGGVLFGEECVRAQLEEPHGGGPGCISTNRSEDGSPTEAG